MSNPQLARVFSHPTANFLPLPLLWEVVGHCIAQLVDQQDSPFMFSGYLSVNPPPQQTTIWSSAKPVSQQFHVIHHKLDDDLRFARLDFDRPNMSRFHSTQIPICDMVPYARHTKVQGFSNIQIGRRANPTKRWFFCLRMLGSGRLCWRTVGAMMFRQCLSWLVSFCGTWVSLFALYRFTVFGGM